MTYYALLFDNTVRLGVCLFRVVAPFNTREDALAWYDANIMTNEAYRIELVLNPNHED